MLAPVHAFLPPSPPSRASGPDAQTRMLGPLSGTHAHEQSSSLQQLLVDWDQEAGRVAGAQVGDGARRV